MRWDRILAAREEGEKVLVFGDRDVDGITSMTLLVQTFKALGMDVSWRLPMGDDPYGLTLEAVEEFAKQDGTLIVTVDCGISNLKEVKRGLELGIDTIIVDHHNPPEEIPPACAVINPKVEDSGLSFSEPRRLRRRGEAYLGPEVRGDRVLQRAGHPP